MFYYSVFYQCPWGIRLFDPVKQRRCRKVQAKSGADLPFSLKSGIIFHTDFLMPVRHFLLKRSETHSPRGGDGHRHAD